MEQRDQSQRMDGALFHFLLLFMTKRTDRAQSGEKVLLTNLYRRSCSQKASLSQSEISYKNMKLFGNLKETVGMWDLNFSDFSLTLS